LVAPATETKTAVDQLFQLFELDGEVRRVFDIMIAEKTGRPQEYYSIRRAMHNIKASVLWVHDEEDEITPLKDVLFVKKDDHPNISFLFTKGLGHRKIYRDEGVIERIVSFL
jgi:hypothetical protein